MNPFKNVSFGALSPQARVDNANAKIAELEAKQAELAFKQQKENKNPFIETSTRQEGGTTAPRMSLNPFRASGGSPAMTGLPGATNMLVSQPGLNSLGGSPLSVVGQTANQGTSFNNTAVNTGDASIQAAVAQMAKSAQLNMEMTTAASLIQLVVKNNETVDKMIKGAGEGANKMVP